MTAVIMNQTKIYEFSTIEKSALIVTLIIVLINALLGYRELALGSAAGGLLFTANIIAIRLIVSLLIGREHNKGFSIFAIILKMTILIALVVSIILFTKINIYGFFIGITGVVIVLIGGGLRGNK